MRFLRLARVPLLVAFFVALSLFAVVAGFGLGAFARAVTE